MTVGDCPRHIRVGWGFIAHEQATAPRRMSSPVTPTRLLEKPGRRVRACRRGGRRRNLPLVRWGGGYGDLDSGCAVLGGAAAPDRSVLFYAVPAFPEQIWVAIDTFVGVVLGILAGNNVVQMRRAANEAAARSVGK